MWGPPDDLQKGLVVVHWLSARNSVFLFSARKPVIIMVQVQGRCVWICLAVLYIVGADRYYADYGDTRGRSIRRRVVTRVTYQEPRDVKLVYRRRKTRPVTVLSSGLDSSYIGGTARRGSVQVVNARPVTARRRVIVVEGRPSTALVPVLAPSKAVVGVPPAVAYPSLGTSYLPVGTSYQPLGGSYQPRRGSYQPGGLGAQYPNGIQPGRFSLKLFYLAMPTGQTGLILM